MIYLKDIQQSDDGYVYDDDDDHDNSDVFYADDRLCQTIQMIEAQDKRHHIITLCGSKEHGANKQLIVILASLSILINGHFSAWISEDKYRERSDTNVLQCLNELIQLFHVVVQNTLCGFTGLGSSS